MSGIEEKMDELFEHPALVPYYCVWEDGRIVIDGTFENLDQLASFVELLRDDAGSH